MRNTSSLVFRHAPQAIALLVWVAIALSALALLVSVVSSFGVGAADHTLEGLRLAPFRWEEPASGSA